MFEKLRNFFAAKTEPAATQTDTSHASAVGSARPRYDLFSNEPADALRGPSGVEIYDKMRRQDPTVQSVVSVICSPLKGAAWTIRAQSDDPKEKEIAEFFFNYFWEKSNSIFTEFLNNCLTFVPFGFSVFEKVWKPVQIDGATYLVIDAQFRPQGSITALDADAQMIKQSINGVDYLTPFKDAAFFVLGKEGDDYWGISALRACYQPYLLKLEQYDNLGIAGSRLASGFLRVSFDGAIKPNTKEYAEIAEAARLISMNKMQAFIASKNIETKFETPTIGAEFYKAAIELLDTAIRNAALANFIGLGTTGTGSYSVGEVQFKLFMKAEKAISNLIEQTFNREILRPMVEANFGPQKNYPELVCQDLDRDAQSMAVALQYFSAGVLSKTEQDDAAIRYHLGLQEAAQDDVEEESGEEPASQQEDSAGKTTASKSGGDSRSRGVELYTADLTRFVRGQLLNIADRIVYKTRRHLENKGAAKLADMLDEISFNDYKEKLTRKISWLCGQGWHFAEEYAKKYGVSAAKKKHKEFDGEIPDEEYGSLPAELRSYVGNKVNVLVSDERQKIKDKVIYAVANNMDSGLSVDNIMAKIGAELDAYASAADIGAAAQIAVVEAINTSENAYYKSQTEEGAIAYFVYELGAAQEHTGYCLSLQGRAFTPWGAAYSAIFPPKHFGCTGHLVPVFWRDDIKMPDNIDDLSGVDLSFQQF
jgi:hypothetical protein